MATIHPLSVIMAVRLKYQGQSIVFMLVTKGVSGQRNFIGWNNLVLTDTDQSTSSTATLAYM